MPLIVDHVRIREHAIRILLFMSTMLCGSQPLGSAALPENFFFPDSGSSAVAPIYLITPAGGAGLDQYEAKDLGRKLVLKSLEVLPDRVKFVNKDFFSFTAKDCAAPGKVCEIIQLTITARKSSRITYGIEHNLLPHAPDPLIWLEKEPPSCEISDTRPATECEDHILRVLANKLLLHDKTAHRPSL